MKIFIDSSAVDYFASVVHSGAEVVDSALTLAI